MPFYSFKHLRVLFLSLPYTADHRQHVSHQNQIHFPHFDLINKRTIVRVSNKYNKSKKIIIIFLSLESIKIHNHQTQDHPESLI